MPKPGEWEADSVLQAIVIADSFNTRFSPLTTELARCLIPLAGTPLIDYTIEFLAAAGVGEIFVFCCAQADKIRAHIEGSKWSGDGTVSVTTIVGQSCLSLGDALRECDSRNIVRGDQFVLVSGDVVANYNFSSLLEVHRQRAKKDPGAMMTMVLKEGNPGHRLRANSELELCAAIEKGTGRLLSLRQAEDGLVDFPTNILANRPAVQFRYDLIDCNIAICSFQVPVLFADNFDYQDLRDFVKGILEHDEIRDDKIFAHVIRKEYAAKVSNLKTYDAVSKDVIHRWSYPLVPSIFSTQGRYAKYKRNNVYICPDVILARSCVIEEDTLIGEGTTVGVEGGAVTRISHSIIGRNCKIGAGVTIEGCYIWDGVTVGDNCKMTKVIAANHVTLMDGITIEAGTLLGDSVVVGPGVHLPVNSRVSLAISRNDDEWSDDEDAATGIPTMQSSESGLDDAGFNEDAIGKGGRGYVWKDLYSPDSEEARSRNWVNEGPAEEQPPSFGLAELETDYDDSSDDESLDDEDLALLEAASQDDFSLFYEEVLDVLRERVRKAPKIEEVELDNVALEVSGSRSAHHMTPRDTARAVLKALIACSDSTLAVKELASYLMKVFKKLVPLLQNYIKTEEDQVEAVLVIKDTCLQCEHALPAFQSLLHLLYDADVLEEAAIVGWFKSDAPTTENETMMHKQVEPLINWLQTAEEEESESESDEESD